MAETLPGTSSRPKERVRTARLADSFIDSAGRRAPGLTAIVGAPATAVTRRTADPHAAAGVAF